MTSASNSEANASRYPSDARSATSSATESRSGENRRPAPISRRAVSPRSGITRTRISFRPSTGFQSSRQPGLIPSLRLTSAGIVTLFFCVIVVTMEGWFSLGVGVSRQAAHTGSIPAVPTKRTIEAMRMLTSQVVHGRLDVPEGSLPAGGTITLLVPEGDEEGFELSNEDRALLLESIAQADRGQVIDGWKLLAEL